MKILVTGANGLVGNGIRSIAKQYPQHQFVFVTRTDADLCNPKDVEWLFVTFQPTAVIHTAARVGGIGRNLNSPAQQYTDNILMNTNMIHYAHRFNVKKFIAFSSVCVFPEAATVLSEDNMHGGPPFPAHWSYAMSKRMVDVQIEAYRKQYGFQGCSVIPGNIFGCHDNYNLEDGHVVPSLIHKFHIAHKNRGAVSVWGDGSSLREFLYAKDVSRVCIDLLEKDELPSRLIVSGEEEHSIKQIVNFIGSYHAQAGDWIPQIDFDESKPNGQKARQTNKDLFRKLFPDFKFTPIKAALWESAKWFEENYPNVRGMNNE